MGTNRSLDDLRSAQFVFTRSIEAELSGLPAFIQEQKAALDAIFAELDAAHRSRLCVGAEKLVGATRSDAWTGRASSALSRAKLFLRATAKEHVREYFPDRGGNASRKIDRLHDVTRVLTVSGHFAHAHLGALRAELEALREEGEEIFGASSVSSAAQRTEVARLGELKVKWEVQYQRLKLLLRGHFYGTPTDCRKFFDPLRLVRTERGEPEGEGTGSVASV